MINELRPAFKTQQSWEKTREMIFGLINCHGRRTITGALSACGNQFNDWSSFYNVFSKMKIDNEKVMQIIQKNILKEVNNQKYIYAHMDDTTIKKTGKHIPGTSWMRDPLGPKFHTNFIWGQRFIQMSLALTEKGEKSESRAIPIDFFHAPSAIKPKKGASKKEIAQYKEDKKNVKLSVQGSKRIAHLRANLDKDGEQLPTPEQIRQSENYPWIQVKAWAAGEVRTFDVKIVRDVRWRSAGEDKNLTLMIIRPLGYRLTKNGVVNYRQPAYLICTDSTLDIQTILQAYVWRWEIEVNFREEKTLLGCGQAQVRNPNSITTVPLLIVAVYALLYLGNYRTEKVKKTNNLPRAKWYKQKEESRTTTGDLLKNIRAQMYAKSINKSFSDFVDEKCYTRSLRNDLNPYISASFFVRN
ncbi:MAG TPA: transposase [Bacteroidales bacterium]|nr:transposase [Bacteroidales bacterium]